MKKNKLISFIVMFVHIVLVITGGWLYIRNPLGKTYSFPFDTMYESSGELKSYHSLGLILFCTVIISVLFFWKDDIKRLLFTILVTLILICIYFIL